MYETFLLQGDSGGPILSGRKLKNGSHVEVLVALHKGTRNPEDPPRERTFVAINVHNYYAWIKYVMDYKKLLNISGSVICCDPQEYNVFRLTEPWDREIADFDTW